MRRGGFDRLSPNGCGDGLLNKNGLQGPSIKRWQLWFLRIPRPGFDKLSPNGGGIAASTGLNAVLNVGWNAGRNEAPEPARHHTFPNRPTPCLRYSLGVMPLMSRKRRLKLAMLLKPTSYAMWVM